MDVLSLSFSKPSGKFCLLFFAVSLIININAYSDTVEDDEDELFALYGDESIISIATGIKQPLSKAPSVASVITAKQIENSGANDLDEVLELIPGLHISRRSFVFDSQYVFRGIQSNFSPQVLVLINGVPITNLFHGDRNLIWGGMPVASIQRIEVIRGPGSAVYGAEAFAGTINVLTKTADDIDGFNAKASMGSFGTYSVAALYGKKSDKYKLALIAELGSTDGHEGYIEEDAQTIIDNSPAATNASLAPGYLSLSRDNLDLRLDLSTEKLTFRSGLQSRTNVGTGAGVAEALDPYNRYKSTRFNADIGWQEKILDDKLKLEVQASYFDVTQEVERNLIIFPPGANLGWGVLEDGLIGNPEIFETHTRFNFTATYSEFSDHTLRVGSGYYLGDLHEVRETKNFGIDPATGDPLPADSPLVDVTDTPYVFLREGIRENTFIYIQDIWQLSTDWELTAGVRYDHYSDFGETTNPRLAIVWSTSQKLTTKIMYGEAFRAPSFAEMRAINNPIVLGNPLLDPERLKSAEVHFEYKVSEDLTLSLNAYKYRWTDIIHFVPDSDAPTWTAQNTGKREGLGSEFELNWSVNKSISVYSNYSWVDTKYVNAGSIRVPFAPHNQLYLGGDWEISDQATMSLQMNRVMDRMREPGDERNPVDDFTLVNINLKYRLGKNSSAQLVVNNLLDEDAREPSVWDAPAANLPNDLPLAGRNYHLRLSFDF